MPRKILVIRLSSLGDVILSAAALSAAKYSLPPEADLDWLVAREFAGVLVGHPRIRRVISFDRQTGFRGLWELAEKLQGEEYDEIWDLHGSIRARFLQIYLTLFSRGVRPAIRRVPKEKGRHFLLLFLKKMLPTPLRPRAKRQLAAICAQGLGNERPDLRHLVSLASADASLAPAQAIPGIPWMAVMPASAWEGKCWPTESFEDVCVSLKGRVLPVILGTNRDVASRALADQLNNRGIPHVDGVGKWTLSQCAAVLARCSFYLGNDTGLAHLAEAVGTPAWVVHGPTSPELGFGPSHPKSRVLSVDLSCRPCGKDGRVCWRLTEPRACLRRLVPHEVVRQIIDALPGMTQGA